MDKSLLELTNQFFNAIKNKDLPTAVNFFSDNAELIDPHYPNPHMIGKNAINNGLSWSFNQLNTFSFKTVNYFESIEKEKAAIEVMSDHELKNGRIINTPQVFIFEVENNKIIRLRAYEPYGPGGIAGIILGIQRLIGKLSGLK